VIYAALRSKEQAGGAVRARRVVGLGLCVVDHVYRVDDIDLRSERTRSSDRLVSPGGMACNATIQAARLGCDARLLTAIGDDAEGRALRRELSRVDVGTRGVLLVPDYPTTVSVVLVARRSGERRFVVPDRRSVERRAPAFDLRAIAPKSVLLVDGHFPAQALRAVRRAREVGATVVGDFSLPRPAISKLLPYVDFPIVPSGFAESYGDGDPQRALRRLRDRFGGRPVVTTGRTGGLYFRGARIRRYPARRVRVRDTTGAGDAFHGAFAAAIAHGLEFEAAIGLAARAASVCCTALGATTALWSGPIPRSRARAAAP
jgi:sulfofructose kinase